MRYTLIKQQGIPTAIDVDLFRRVGYTNIVASNFNLQEHVYINSDIELSLIFIDNTFNEELFNKYRSMIADNSNIGLVLLYDTGSIVDRSKYHVFNIFENNPPIKEYFPYFNDRDNFYCILIHIGVLVKNIKLPAFTSDYVYTPYLSRTIVMDIIKCIRRGIRISSSKKNHIEYLVHHFGIKNHHLKKL
jgi:hypothetical protein